MSFQLDISLEEQNEVFDQSSISTMEIEELLEVFKQQEQSEIQ